MQEKSYDYLIIGAGIIGITIARELIKRYPHVKILILDKEKSIGYHISGRNSGVLHAGFYYHADSLKAKFARLGNQAMTAYCAENNLTINKCGKVVVASNEQDLTTLYELQKRGSQNNSEIIILDDKELYDIEPNAKTFEKAIFSPHTSTIDPVEVLQCMINELQNSNVQINSNDGYKRNLSHNTILTTQNNIISATKIINTAGLYADKIAKDFGFANDYTIIPFKGIYLEYSGNEPFIRTNIYPVPNIKNPFLGVHFTITAHGKIKIGPTAMPVFWRENYKGLDRFKLNELFSIFKWESKLFIKNNFDFRNLVYEELKKYNRSHLTKLASNMLHNIDTSTFTNWSKAGIRAQLLNTQTLELVQDFVVEADNSMVNVLNAVSPGFTCSIPFATWIVDKYL